MMNPLKQNLVHARAAIEHVREHIEYGAANRWDDLVASGGRSIMCVLSTRVAFYAAGDDLKSPIWLNGRVPDDLFKRAVLATVGGCGNCGEQSAVAFVFLFDRRVSPIHYMLKGDGSHAFIAIGVDSRANEMNPSTWGKGAVVCDPWNNVAYPANEIQSRMFEPGEVVKTLTTAAR